MITDDIKKMVQDWLDTVDVKSDEVVKVVKDGSKGLADTLKTERRKLEIRSQIGEHQRTLQKAYARLGEAYFESVDGTTSMNDMKDVLELIRSNRKLVRLLEEQLEAMK